MRYFTIDMERIAKQLEKMLFLQCYFFFKVKCLLRKTALILLILWFDLFTLFHHNLQDFTLYDKMNFINILEACKPGSKRNLKCKFASEYSSKFGH